MGGIGLLNWATLYMVNFPSADMAINPVLRGVKIRPLTEIASHPVFLLSCTVATIAHTVMVMIMSNCALSMEDDYSFGTTSVVIELHFLGMFLPGFFTGKLIQDYGTFNVSVLGAVLFAVSAVVFIIGEDLWNYFLGMILLGVAWNFSFSAGTVMLTQSYQVTTIPPVCCCCCRCCCRCGCGCPHSRSLYIAVAVAVSLLVFTPAHFILPLLLLCPCSSSLPLTSFCRCC
jgi:MFS family permease